MKFKLVLNTFLTLTCIAILHGSGFANDGIKMKNLDSLVVADSAWTTINASLLKSKDAKAIPVLSKTNAEKELFSAQVSTHSYMGAIIYNSGGILVKNGWLRIWGSGSEELPRSIAKWNKDNKITGYLVVADDVIGGVFAVNGGAFGTDLGSVYYFSPQSLKWDSLRMPYSKFIEWSLTKNLDVFYSGLYWDTWKKDIPGLNADKSVSVYPPLWANGPDIRKRSLRAISFKESYAVQQHYSDTLEK